MKDNNGPEVQLIYIHGVENLAKPQPIIQYQEEQTEHPGNIKHENAEDWIEIRERKPVMHILLNVAKKRTNVVPIIEDARHPHKYRMLVPMVDCVFSDVAQPDQGRIVALNAQYFLKNGGNFVISIKANCIDSTAEPEAVFAGEVKKMQAEKLKPQEQVTLEPYERDHAVVVGIYRPPPKA